MKKFQIVVLSILVFLAVSSGVTKILLMPQDAVFFGKYGFTSLLLIAFGATQVVGGLMMLALKTREIGAAIVAVTFAISAVLLILEGSVPTTIATFIALAFLGLTIKWTNAARNS